LLSAPHRGSARAVDLAWLPSGAAAEEKPRALAADVDPSARFLDAAGKRAAFGVLDSRHPGVYVADIP
jgi:hypothetical protein